LALAAAFFCTAFTFASCFFAAAFSLVRSFFSAIFNLRVFIAARFCFHFASNLVTALARSALDFFSSDAA
jgi:hypothetical protein